MLLVSNLKIAGFFTPEGRKSVIASSLSRISFIASAIGVPARNSSVTIEALSWLFVLICLSLSIPLRLFSSGLETLVSISAALAPG